MNSLNLDTFKKERDILYFDAKATARLSRNRKFLTIDFQDEARPPETISEKDFTHYVGNQILPVTKVSEEHLRMPLTRAQAEKIKRGTITVEAMIEAEVCPGGAQLRASICRDVARKHGYKTVTPAKTAYNWYKAYHREGGLYAYFTSRKNKRQSKRRFSMQVREMADELLTNIMFNPALLKSSLTFVHETLRARMKKIDPKARIPSYETLRAWFYEYDPMLVKKAKEGRVSLRKAVAQNVAKSYVFFRPLERVEADAMHVTLNLVDKHGKQISTKIIIYFLIDCFSRSVLGFYLQVGGGESEAGVIQSIRHAILIKHDERWIQCGLPSEITVDGGVAYRSLTTQSELFALGIGTRIVATGAGYRKPFVERFIGTCRERFFATLPGYLAKQDDQKRAEVEIKNSIPYSVDEIEQMLTRWILEEYHLREHEGLYGSTPLATWRQGIIDHPITYVNNHHSADIWLGKEVYPTISGPDCHQGVQIQKIRYNDQGNQLQTIGIRLKNGNKSATVKCFWNENDVSAITVIDPHTHKAFRAFATDQHIKPGMSKTEFEDVISRLYPKNTTAEDTPILQAELFDTPHYQEKLKYQEQCIKQQQRSRTSSAKVDELSDATRTRLTSDSNTASQPIVDAQAGDPIEDNDGDAEFYDYE